jgi:hypothetical protein
MSFWSVAGPEPKRNYRWNIIFPDPNGNLGQLTYALKKANKPKGSFKEAFHAYLNHKFYYPGRFEWDTIQLTFASITKPDATHLINKVMIDAGYGVPSAAAPNGSQVATPGKRKFAGAIGQYFKINQLDADGHVIESWKINNPFFTSISFGDGLSYEDENIVEIQCTVRYDWAELETKDPVELTNPIPTGPGYP